MIGDNPFPPLNGGTQGHRTKAGRSGVDAPSPALTMKPVKEVPLASTAYKTCSACRQHLPLQLFSKQAGYVDGYRSQCRKCRSRKTAEYIQRTGYRSSTPRNPKADRAGHLRRKYGLSLRDYDLLVLKQGGVCAICSAKPDGLGLRVDHCHETGKVRGLLCGKCNTALGSLGDNEAGIRRALEYLQLAQAAGAS